MKEINEHKRGYVEVDDNHLLPSFF